jgi:hypothetical protein
MTPLSQAPAELRDAIVVLGASEDIDPEFKKKEHYPMVLIVDRDQEGLINNRRNVRVVIFPATLPKNDPVLFGKVMSIVGTLPLRAEGDVQWMAIAVQNLIKIDEIIHAEIDKLSAA